MITYLKNQENNYIWVQGAKKGPRDRMSASNRQFLQINLKTLSLGPLYFFIYFFLFKKYNTSCFRGSFTFGAGNLTLPNHHLNTTKYNPIESMAPQIKSITECCFRKTVERQMRTVRTHETFLMRFLELSFCICLLLTKQR